jgi:ribonucleoside-diphosphate reductase alpha chain
VKALAIYRDGSKTAQALRTDAQESKDLETDTAEAVAEPRPVRRRMPRERESITHKFSIAGHEGYITVGLYRDGQPGEIFLKMAKEGSTVSGLMDTLATTISVALQYGVPLRDLVNKFAHVRFEPSGFTGNQEIPIAKSIVDYIFRWLGSRFLTIEDRQNLGLQPATVADSSPSIPVGFGAQSPSPSVPGAPGAGPASRETSAFGAQSPADAGQPQATQSDEPRATAVASEVVEAPGVAAEELKVIAANGQANGHAANGNGKTTSNGNGGGSPSTITLNLGQTKVSFQTQADAPSCADCVSIMIRNGSCYNCLNCGSTSGCS